jgi:hypothetical protein
MSPYFNGRDMGMTGGVDESLILFLLALALLPLDHNEYELVIGGGQDLILGGLEAHELEFVVGVEVAHGVPGLGDELRDEPCEGVA